MRRCHHKLKLSKFRHKWSELYGPGQSAKNVSIQHGEIRSPGLGVKVVLHDCCQQCLLYECKVTKGTLFLPMLGNKFTLLHTWFPTVVQVRSIASQSKWFYPCSVAPGPRQFVSISTMAAVVEIYQDALNSLQKFQCRSRFPVKAV